MTSEIAPTPVHGQPRLQPAGISPTGTAAIVRHFPVSDCSDQSNDLRHLLSLHGYRNKTAATSVPPLTQLPVTSRLTIANESTHSESRDAAGSGELEKGGREEEEGQEEEEEEEKEKEEEEEEEKGRNRRGRRGRRRRRRKRRGKRRKRRGRKRGK